jgi:hypothetical protein
MLESGPAEPVPNIQPAGHEGGPSAPALFPAAASVVPGVQGKPSCTVTMIAMQMSKIIIRLVNQGSYTVIRELP